jgi:hypothetical protein
MPARALTITPARIAASRANGARSRGPKTSAGKARSCRNATRHGLFARDPLPIPDTDPYLQTLIADCLRRFPDPDPTELAMIRDYAVCRTRLRYFMAMEKDWLDEALAALPDPSAPGSLGAAFSTVSETAGFRMLQRHESSAFRTAHSLLANLLARRKFKNDETNPNLCPAFTDIQLVEHFPPRSIPSGPAHGAAGFDVRSPGMTSRLVPMLLHCYPWRLRRYCNSP